MRNIWLGLILMSWLWSLGSCKQEEVTTSTVITKDDGTSESIDIPLTYLALGDSYTIGQSVTEEDRFPVQLAAALKAEGYEVAAPKIIARTGWTTGNLLSALNSDPPANNYNLVSLLIGVNNQYRGQSLATYKAEFTSLLNKAIAYAGGYKSNVIVVSIPDYGYTPFGKSNQPNISAELDAFNAENKEITIAAGIAYVDITPISRRGLNEPDLVASDNLHPSGKQYSEWVDKILPEAIQILKQ